MDNSKQLLTSPTAIIRPSSPTERIRLKDLPLKQVQAIRQNLLTFSDDYSKKGKWNFKQTSSGLVKLYQSPPVRELIAIDASCRSAVSVVLDHQVFGLVSFLWATRLNEDMMVSVCDQITEALLELNLSLFAILHAIKKIKLAEKPFDYKFHGVEPREILRMIREYGSWLGRQVLKVEEQVKPKESIPGRMQSLAKFLRESGQMPKLIEIARKNKERERKQRKEQAGKVGVAPRVSLTGLRLFNKISLWATQNLPLEHQGTFLEGLRDKWTSEYHHSQIFQSSMTVGEFYERRANQFLQNPTIDI